MNRGPPRRAVMVLGVPVMLAGITMAGLVIGLTGAGWRDALCVGALALPLLLFLFHVLRRESPRSSANPKARP